MQRTQIYLTDEQRRRLARCAAIAETSQSEAIRSILDRALGISPGSDERLDAIEATAGLLSDHPDWPEWLAAVRGPGTGKRLRSLGL